MKNQLLQAVKATKSGKKRKVRCTVFPARGGRPYFLDVEPTDDGMLEIEGQSYLITRGSVWEESGVLRCILNEGNPHTVSAESLAGDDSFSPNVLHAVATNNFIEQFAELANRGSVWRQASTWGFLILGVVLVLMLLWMNATLGSGLEGVEGALNGLEVQAPQPSRTPAEAAGHQNIGVR